MHIANLKKGGMKRNNAVISGGASNSGLWCQMFADILNMEILTTQTSEVGVLGLAICQGLGTGLYADIKDAILKLVRIKSSFKPNPEKNALYMKRYNEFQKIFRLLEDN